MPDGVSNRSEYINQLRVLLPADEFAKLDFNVLSDTELAAKLGQALNNNAQMGEFDVVQITAQTLPGTPAEPTAKGTTVLDGGFIVKEYAEGADTVVEKYEGEQIQENLREKIIKHTDENQNVVETVITYSKGKPIRKEVKKNGNTFESSTIEADEDGYTITTKKTGGSKITTNVKNLDDNGNFSDEDFISRTTILLSGERRTVRIAEEGNIREIINNREGTVVVNYAGNSITDFDNNLLEETDRRNVGLSAPTDGCKRTEVILDDGYRLVTEIYDPITDEDGKVLLAGSKTVTEYDLNNIKVHETITDENSTAEVYYLDGVETKREINYKDGRTQTSVIDGNKQLQQYLLINPN